MDFHLQDWITGGPPHGHNGLSLCLQMSLLETTNNRYSHRRFRISRKKFKEKIKKKNYI